MGCLTQGLLTVQSGVLQCGTWGTCCCGPQPSESSPGRRCAHTGWSLADTASSDTRCTQTHPLCLQSLPCTTFCPSHEGACAADQTVLAQPAYTASFTLTLALPQCSFTVMQKFPGHRHQRPGNIYVAVKLRKMKLHRFKACISGQSARFDAACTASLMNMLQKTIISRVVTE